MKKLLCIFMAVLMVFSSAFVFGASAAEGYAARNTLEKFDSYSDFVAKNGDKEIFGFTYDTLYESNSFVDWTKLDISYSSENGPVYYDKGAFSLAFGDISAYLKRVTAFFFSGDRLFSEENALNITNFIGKMINPDFKEVTYMFGTSVTPNEEDFFLQIAKQSGLGDIMQNNWCGKGPDFFKPFLSAFGVDLTKITTSDFGRGDYVAKALIRTVVNQIIALGPVDFIYSTLKTLSIGYSTYLFEPTTALFKLKTSQGKPVLDENGNVIGRTGYGVDEFKTVAAFLTYAFDGVIDYDFFRFPDSRLSDANRDNSDKTLFFLMYLAINYRYKNNAAIVDSLIGKIRSYALSGNRYAGAGYDYDSIILALDNIERCVEFIFKGDLSLETVEMLNNLTQENLSAVPDNMKFQLRNWLAKMLKKVADYFDYIFKLLTGEIKYGESMLDRLT